MIHFDKQKPHVIIIRIVSTQGTESLLKMESCSPMPLSVNPQKATPNFEA